MLEGVPELVDIKADWLVKYWAEKLAVSQQRLISAVLCAGPEIRKIKKHLTEGYRIAIRDELGVDRLVARIFFEQGGFAVSVPKHPEKKGWLFQIPVRYDAVEYEVALKDAERYTVENTAKLSLHMNGFVQFSSGEGGPIISGIYKDSGAIKGVGLLNQDRVQVTGGPLFGVALQGLHRFPVRGTKHALVFEKDDLWHHPKFSTSRDSAYHLEVFMLPNSLSGRCRIQDGKRLITMPLPFRSRFKFEFDLRVVELPQADFFLGIILSHCPRDEEYESGYKLVGPSCRDPDGRAKAIGAIYPRPSYTAQLNPRVLDFLRERPDETESSQGE